MKLKNKISSFVSLKKKGIFVIALFLMLGVVVPTIIADAAGVSFPEKGLIIILGTILSVGAAFWGGILTLEGHVFNYVVEESLKIANFKPVVDAWVTVRDIFNLLFIIALLAMAFATILQIQNWQIKNLLPKVLYAILLVNFSRTICAIFIEFSNVFVNSLMPESLKGNISNSWLHLTGLTTVMEIATGGTSPISEWEMLGSFFYMVLMMMILALVLVIVIIFFVIRMVALMILTAISPAVYAMMVLPVTQKYVNQWWTTFMKYIFYGPLAVFFIGMGVSVIEFEREILGTAHTLGIQDESTFVNKGADAIGFLTIVLACVMLLAAVWVARTLGIAGAGAVIGAAKKGYGGVGKLASSWSARRAAKWGMGAQENAWQKSESGTQRALGKLYATAGKATAYGIGLPKAWANKKKTEEEEIINQGAAAQAEDMLWGTLSNQKRHVFDRAHRSKIEKRKKEQRALSSAEQVRNILDSIDSKDKDGIEAGLDAAGEANNLNDVLSNDRIFEIVLPRLQEMQERTIKKRQRDEFLEKGSISKERENQIRKEVEQQMALFEYDSDGNKVKKKDDDGVEHDVINAHYDPNFVPEVIKEFLGDTPNGTGVRFATDLSERGAEKGNWGLVGMTTRDDDNNLAMADDMIYSKLVINDKFRKSDPQATMRGTHVNSFVGEKGGDFTHLTEQGVEILQNLPPGVLEHVNRLRGDVLKGLTSDIKYTDSAGKTTSAKGTDHLRRIASNMKSDLRKKITKLHKRSSNPKATKDERKEIERETDILASQLKDVEQRADLLKRFADQVDKRAKGPEKK